MSKVKTKDVVSSHERFVQKTYITRGQKVMLDFDLATLYEVDTETLCERVKENHDRFPSDFLFRLTAGEWGDIQSQMNDSSSSSLEKNGEIPFAFTEHGIIMLASVLDSKKAVKMNIALAKAFIDVEIATSKYHELAIECLKLHLVEHDSQLNSIYTAIESLLEDNMEREAWTERKRVGFRINEG